jgi:hypothetical protein
MKTIICHIFLVSLLFGCASRMYIEPTSSATAKLEIISKTKDPITTVTYKEVNQCTNRQFIAYLSTEPKKEIKIKANEPMVITSIIPQPMGVESVLMAFGAVGALASGTTYKECKPTIEFIPRDNHSYIFTLNSTKKGCEFSLSEKDASNNINPDFKFTAHKWKKPFTEDGSWCE